MRTRIDEGCLGDLHCCRAEAQANKEQYAVYIVRIYKHSRRQGWAKGETTKGRHLGRARSSATAPETRKEDKSCSFPHQRPTGTETVPSSLTLMSRVLPACRNAASTPAGGDAAAACAPFAGDSARKRKAGDGSGRTPRRRAESSSQLTCGKKQKKKKARYKGGDNELKIKTL